MSEQVEMEEEDKISFANSGNQGGEKKRFEVKKVFHSFKEDFSLL